MVSVILVLLFAVAVFVIPRLVESKELARNAAMILLAAYTVRMLFMAIVTWSDLPLVWMIGGDCDTYEWSAMQVARRWEIHNEMEFTEEGALSITTASLPINTFAFLVYLNGGPCRAACTAVVAGLACLTSYNLYRLAIDLGSEPRFAQRALLIQLFMPGYFVYTANMYKDGLVAFFVIGAFTAAVRLAQRFSVVQVATAVVSLIALYYTRVYMVVMAGIPLLASFAGTRSAGWARRLLAPIVAAAALGALATSSSAVGEFSEHMESIYDRATQEDVEIWNAKGASGVRFDDGGDPLGAMGPKIAYTLFSPFPWMGGSIALQVGKIDVLVWYYLCYRALRSAKQLWKDDRGLLLIFIAFLVPSTVAYATTMANVGLIFRQRIPIVMIGTLLGMLSWRKLNEAGAPAPAAPSPDEPAAQPPPEPAPAE